MGILVVNLSTGKGSWKAVGDLIDCAEWEQVFIVTNSFGADKFSCSRLVNFVVVDLNDSVLVMRDKIISSLASSLRSNIGFFDVALNFTSGSGKEHMALMSAILKLGVGIRIVDFENSRLVEL